MISNFVTRSAAEWYIDVADAKTRAVYEPARAGDIGARVTFVCGHGAGGSLSDRGMTRVAELFRSRGIGVVRFNFLYSESRSRRPDRMPSLKQCFSAVVARTREEFPSDILLIGGRSMGGRVASMLAAEAFPCDGLLLLAYPLHPAGKPEQLRNAHFPSIQVPVLCFNGTRDALCRRDLMEAALAPVADRWTMHWLEGADHSFHVLKSSGRTDTDVLDEIGEKASAWLSHSMSSTARFPPGP